jgi:integrase/recombinase XerD
LNEKLTLLELVKKAESRLTELNYSKSTICGYMHTWKKLIAFAEQEKEQYFTVEFGDKFLAEKYGISIFGNESTMNLSDFKAKALRRYIFVLGDLQANGVVSRKRNFERVLISEALENIKQKYLLNCQERYNGSKTIYRIKSSLNRFFLFLEQIGIHDIINIDISCVTEYTKTLLDMSQRTIGNELGNIRRFFVFLYNEEYHKKDLSVCMLRVNCGRAIKLPKIWTDSEVAQLLNSIDRGTSVGKRDYAIFMLICKLGFRTGDVQNLKFENILWSKGVIQIIQEKTKVSIELPISQEVGDAIIDYLKYGRPEFNQTPYVFIRHIAPYEKMMGLGSRIKTYVTRAGIRVDRAKLHGMHSLRHTLATKLLEKNVPLETISGVLGHQSVNSTKVYLAVDLKSLRNCALNTEEVFVNAEDFAY